MKKLNIFLSGLFLILIQIYSYLVPYTKVEESFNVQAIHDILNYSFYPQEKVLKNYDHIKFPGVVPRSFIGSLIISGIVKILIYFFRFFGINLFKNEIQIIILKLTRLILGLINGLLLINFGKTYYRQINVKNHKNLDIERLFLLLLISQFHIVYYGSRLLPNFICLPFVLYSFSKILKNDFTALKILAFAGVTLRIEVFFFTCIIGIVSIVLKKINVFKAVFLILQGTMIGLVSTIIIDSYFWNKILVPEFMSFFFNVIENNSEKWGIEPWNSYFTKHIFKIFKPPLPIILIIIKAVKYFIEKKKKTIDYNLQILFISSITYLVFMSFEKHKEWRFIIYVVPIFTLESAVCINLIKNKIKNVNLNFFFEILVVLNFFLGFLFSVFICYLSSYNYPGGDALQFLNSHIKDLNQSNEIKIHMDVGPCMTGISRFGEIHNVLFHYDKTETMPELEKLWNDFDFLITDSSLELHNINSYSSIDLNNWIKVKEFYIFEKLNFNITKTFYSLYDFLPNKKNHYNNLSSSDLINKIKKLLNSFIKTKKSVFLYKKKNKIFITNSNFF